MTSQACCRHPGRRRCRTAQMSRNSDRSVFTLTQRAQPRLLPRLRPLRCGRVVLPAAAAAPTAAASTLSLQDPKVRPLACLATAAPCDLKKHFAALTLPVHTLSAAGSTGAGLKASVCRHRGWVRRRRPTTPALRGPVLQSLLPRPGKHSVSAASCARRLDL